MKKYGICALALTAVLFLTCCGRKGPVLPPVKKAPKPVLIQKAFQRGEHIFLKWEKPSSYLDGSPLTDLSKIEVWKVRKAYKQNESPSIDGKEFRKQSSLTTVIRSRDFPEFTENRKDGSPVFVYSYKLKPSEYNSTVLFWCLKAVDGKGRDSDFSKPVSVLPQIAPNPPSGLKAEAVLDRVKLDWTEPETNTDGSSPPRVKGYNVYRSFQQNAYDQINEELINDTCFEDSQIVLGREYQYFVRSSAFTEPPFLESDNSEVVVIQVKDTIPPEKPEGLVLIVDQDRITISWDRSAADDVRGYHVWRRKKGEETFVLLNSEPVAQNAFHDLSAQISIEYEYCVSAIDRAGNESEKSETISGERIGRIL
jgi:predicted small lipoprotein YifL